MFFAAHVQAAPPPVEPRCARSPAGAATADPGEVLSAAYVRSAPGSRSRNGLSVQMGATVLISSGGLLAVRVPVLPRACARPVRAGPRHRLQCPIAGAVLRAEELVRRFEAASPSPRLVASATANRRCGGFCVGDLPDFEVQAFAPPGHGTGRPFWPWASSRLLAVVLPPHAAPTVRRCRPRDRCRGVAACGPIGAGGRMRLVRPRSSSAAAMRSLTSRWRPRAGSLGPLIFRCGSGTRCRVLRSPNAAGGFVLALAVLARNSGPRIRRSVGGLAFPDLTRHWPVGCRPWSHGGVLHLRGARAVTASCW